MFNKVIMVGNLTRDPELRYTASGKAVATIGIAVNTKFGDTDEVLFIDVVAWNKTAENASQYLAKGRQIIVEGRLQEREWEGNDGQKRKKMEIVASTVKFMGKKTDSTGQCAPKDTAPDEVSDIEPF